MFFWHRFVFILSCFVLYLRANDCIYCIISSTLQFHPWKPCWFHSTKNVQTEDLAVVFSQFNGFREAAHCQHSGSQSSDDICLRFQVNVEPVNQLSNYLGLKRHSTLQSTNLLDFWWWWGSAKAKVIWRSKLKHFNRAFELCAHAGQYFDTSIDSIIHWHV